MKLYRLWLYRKVELYEAPISLGPIYKEVAVATRTKNVPQEKQIETAKRFALKLNPDYDLAIEVNEIGKAVHALFTAVRPRKKIDLELTDFDMLMRRLFVGSPEDYAIQRGKN